MALGDDAVAQGYARVTGSNLIRDGDDEINRTRDYIAQVKVTLATTPTGWRTKAGISSGPTDPTGGADGDIYFKTL